MISKPRNGYMPECSPLTCASNCCKSKEIFYVDKDHPLQFELTAENNLATPI